MSGEDLRRIGPYVVQENIGHGGMAAVYRAYQPSLDRVVAIKVISAHLAAEPEFMERFRQEARAIARLNHPNIVVVHDFGEHDGLPYLVLEHVDGPTLAELLDDPLPQEHVADLLTQIAAGLDYAHSRGIVHRDVKPHNVLITREGRAVLADFGLARMVEGAQQLTMVGGIVGTPEYMSPEQAAGRPTDHRADVYALGVLLFEMITGQRPFTAETPLGVLMKHLQDMAPPLRQFHADLPPALDAVIQTALAKQPDDRYQSAGALARAYREALASVPVAQLSATAVAAAPVLAVAHAAPNGHTPHTPHSAGALLPCAPPAGRSCPACQAMIPSGTSICPACTFLLPFEEVATRPILKEPERRQVRVNLLPFNLRWDPAGLERARQLTRQTVASLTVEGWELLAPVEASGTFVQGRTAGGTVVQSAVLTLQRNAN